MNNLQALCEDIRIRRLTAKLTQVQLSELTGIRQDRISQIENGKSYFKVTELFDIARVLGPFEIKVGE